MTEEGGRSTPLSKFGIFRILDVARRRPPERRVAQRCPPRREPARHEPLRGSRKGLFSDRKKYGRTRVKEIPKLLGKIFYEEPKPLKPSPCGSRFYGVRKAQLPCWDFFILPMNPHPSVGDNREDKNNSIELGFEVRALSSGIYNPQGMG